MIFCELFYLLRKLSEIPVFAYSQHAGICFSAII
jgi:hypothetical protein